MKKDKGKVVAKGSGAEPRVRNLREVASVGGQNSDWTLTLQTDDSQLWQNAWALTARVRSLFQANPIYIKYRESLWANIFGDKGIMLRMKVKETEDRIVHASDEKWALIQHEKRIQRLRDWAEGRTGLRAETYRAFHLADSLDRTKRDDVLRGVATIQVGAPDVFANQRIEGGFTTWQRAEYCDIRQKREYNVLRQLRLISAVRDGDFFIRLICDPRVNKFGFTLQLINAEWCDRFYNTVLQNGNVVIMGIEYLMTDWGVGKPVAFYFIKRQPQDWQFSVPGAFNFSAGQLHTRVAAEEIIHYARPVDADATRPAPWVCSTIPKGRQLDQYELAEVIAAREAACKVGFLYSDINPEGGQGQTPIDPRTSLPKQAMSPGDMVALQWGVKYQERDPKHPNQNLPGFSKEMLRRISAGMPGADYNVLANDLENINFSAGRLGRLDTTEISKNIQEFDITTAERKIFETWLEMSLITGAIPLPIGKFEKFNKPVFQGRAFKGVDETKDVTASALRIANKLSSRSRECADDCLDFEEVVFEQAEEEMLMESLGLTTVLTVESVKPSVPAQDTADGEGEPSQSKKPSKNGKHLDASEEEAEREYQESLALHTNLTAPKKLRKRQVNGR